jgi:hypothetical protein
MSSPPTPEYDPLLSLAVWDIEQTLAGVSGSELVGLGVQEGGGLSGDPIFRYAIVGTFEAHGKVWVKHIDRFSQDSIARMVVDLLLKRYNLAKTPSFSDRLKEALGR